FGVSVNTYGVNDLVEAVDSASDAAVSALVKEYADTYRLAPELALGADRHDSLRYAARIELGLRSFLDDGGFGAFTTNFEDLGGLRQLPGLAVQRLMADGYGFGGEGDWKTATLLATVKAMGAGLPGGTSFMEDYTYHLVPGADMGDRFRLVANTIEVVPPAEPLPALPVARAVWRPEPDLRTSTEAWLTAGGPHHTVLSTAIGPEELTDLADILTTELLLIDNDTTLRRFTQEIRWNQAYYRLARGL
uniref:L-arabinose isomerase family protein n=1 Tax=Streptomyces sp. NRRL F-5123 TaxID=1463856 RepID=UPI0004E1D316